MSLRYQISLRILLISLVILLLGGTISIWQARKAVNKEVDASINLTLQLIKIGISTSKIQQTDWIQSLSHLEQTRHLIIQFKKPSGEIINMTKQPELDQQNENAPDWFINLVVSEYPKAEYKIDASGSQALTLIVQANPMDEIAEVWHETLAFFSSLVLLVLLTFLSVHLVFNKTLKTIKLIVDHLKGIEKGEYQNKLPNFSTFEYDNIASAINHMTDVLHTTQKQNKALTQHSLEIQEDERQHLSQELHDEFGQSLTAIKVMTVTSTHKNADIQQLSNSIINICDHLMTVVRSMMKQLHPLILTELGLKATLEDMIQQWENRNSPLSFSLHCDDAVDHLDKPMVIQIFRVIQESLTNIIRHAEASHVKINLTIQSDPKALQLFISDDGQGCNLDQVASGFGLMGMEERIKLLGGNLKLHSHSQQGMQISAQIPLS